MLMRSGIGVFALRLLVVYGLLAIPWHGLGTHYARAFQGAANLLFHEFGSSGQASFLPLADADTRRDTQLVLTNRNSGREIATRYGSRYTGYLPTAAFLALTLATPLNWSRRVLALGLGLPLMSAFVALRVAISLMQGFRFVGLFVFSQNGNFAVDVACEVISKSTITSFFVPVFLWLAICFRLDDLRGAMFLDPGRRGRSSSSK